MSLCRFSSDNWKSDVYIYESDCGFEVHVAASRHAGEIPPLLEWGVATDNEWLARHQGQMTALESAERVPIGGPSDGQSYTYLTLQDLRDGLNELMSEGYHVPAYVFDFIEEDMQTAVTDD